MSRCSFAKTFGILLCREVRAQKLIHDTNSYAFQPATALPNISCFLCLKLYYIFYHVYKFWICSDNANSTDFLFFIESLYYFLYSSLQVVHLAIFFTISFEFLFLNLYLGALFYKKIKEKKIWLQKKIIKKI